MLKQVGKFFTEHKCYKRRSCDLLFYPNKTYRVFSSFNILWKTKEIDYLSKVLTSVYKRWDFSSQWQYFDHNFLFGAR